MFLPVQQRRCRCSSVLIIFILSSGCVALLLNPVTPDKCACILLLNVNLRLLDNTILGFEIVGEKLVKVPYVNTKDKAHVWLAVSSPDFESRIFIASQDRVVGVDPQTFTQAEADARLRLLDESGCLSMIFDPER